MTDLEKLITLLGVNDPFGAERLCRQVDNDLEVADLGHIIRELLLFAQEPNATLSELVEDLEIHFGIQ